MDNKAIEKARRDVIAQMGGGVSLYIVNPKTEEFQIISQNEYLSENYPSDESFTASITRYIKADIFGPDKKRVAEEISISAMESHLELEKEYIVQYRDVSSGNPRWFEMKAIRLSDTEILYGFTDKDEEILLGGLSEKLLDDNFSIFAVDLDSEILKVIKRCPWDERFNEGDEMSFVERMKDFVEINEGDTKDFYREMCDVEKVKKSFTNEDKKCYSYYSRFGDTEKWVYLTTYVLTRHEDGTPSALTMCFSLMDSLGIDRILLNKKMKENMDIIGGLASNYAALFHVNLESGKYQVYIASPQMMQSKQYFDSFDTFDVLVHHFIDSVAIHEDFKEELHEFFKSNVGIREKLNNKKSLSTTFKCFFGQEYLWSRMTVIKCEDIAEEAENIVLCFEQCDDETRTSQALANCIEVIGEKISPKDAIEKLLVCAADYFEGERAYVFEYGRQREIIKNTYEWCLDGIEPMKDQLQNIAASEIDGWIEEFNRSGPFYMSTLDEHNTPTGRAILEMQGINSLVAAPIMNGNEIEGFIGVDNPKRGNGRIYVLRTIASEIYSEMLRRNEVEGHNAFTKFFLEPFDSAYYIALDDMTCQIYKLSGRMKERYAQIPNYYTSFLDYIEHFVHEDDKDEFRELVKPESIKKLFETQTTYSHSYREFSTGEEQIVRCQIIRGEDDLHAAVGFINVTGIVKEQRDAQRRLQQDMEIISGLTSEYLALYYVNFADDNFTIYSVDGERLNDTTKLLSKSNDPVELIAKFAQSKAVHPDDKHLFEGLTKEETKRRLSGRKRFSVRFRRDYGQGYLWSVMDVVKYEDVDEEAKAIIIGFAERDDEIRREQEQAQEKELANQQRHTKAFGDMINAGLWSMDIKNENDIISVNWSDEFRHMLGFESEEDFPNTLDSWSGRIYPEDRERVLKHYWDCIKSTADNMVYNINYRIIKKNGECCWYHAAGRMEMLEGNARRLFGIIEDISADKKLEEQRATLREALSMAQAANKAKTSFLNNMSHDIRTPMNAIIGYTGLAENHMDDPDKVRDYLNKISQSSSHLLSLINDVLDMSRIESGKMGLNETPENIKDILSALQAMEQAEIDSKGIEFSMDTLGILNENIICDKLKLNQVLINVLSNAVKYTPNGGCISVQVSEKAVKKHDYGTYEFHITDNGMGMDEEFLSTIFDPFTRAKNTTVSGIQGTGLGMPITKNMVDMMGGTIEIISEVDVGTEVIISFNFKYCEPDEANLNMDPAEQELQAMAESVDFSGRTILLVEDNELNREIAEEILTEFGFKVVTAEDGDIAVDRMKMARSGDYDLILMDIQMPTMDGYEATRQIREIGTRACKIPIIAMTANAFDEDRQTALEVGMIDHIAKPINVDKLKKTLAKYLY